MENPGRLQADTRGHGVGLSYLRSRLAQGPGDGTVQPDPAGRTRARDAGHSAMKTLIVDDTRLARQELKTLLASHADIELVGEAEDLPGARDAVQRLQPDLLLLDIQLPSGTGFDLLEQLDPLPW